MRGGTDFTGGAAGGRAANDAAVSAIIAPSGRSAMTAVVLAAILSGKRINEPLSFVGRALLTPIITRAPLLTAACRPVTLDVKRGAGFTSHSAPRGKYADHNSATAAHE